MTSDGEFRRATVRTYVPEYQKERWREQADDLGMSLSEFVRTMVQAGRSDFEVPDPPTGDSSGDPPGSRDATPRGQALEDRILAVLDEDGYSSWDELLDGLTADIEDRMEGALETLQRENRVTHSGRHGGYTLIDDE
jgi:hypothetical protein